MSQCFSTNLTKYTNPVKYAQTITSTLDTGRMSVGSHTIILVKLIMNEQEMVFVNLVLLKIELRQFNFTKVITS